MPQLNVLFQKEEYSRLKALADKLGISPEEMIFNALRVYRYLLTQKDLGKSIYLGRNDRPEEEVLL